MVSTFVFGLRSTIRTIAAYETEELKDNRRLFESPIQIAREEIKLIVLV